MMQCNGYSLFGTQRPDSSLLLIHGAFLPVFALFYAMKCFVRV